MPKSKIHTKPKSTLWGWLTSIRLTVFLLLILAGVAVIGTFIQQDQPAMFYLAHYGEFWGGIIFLGHLSIIYYSPWFLAPVTLLALNISACLIRGLPQAWRRSFMPLTAEVASTLPERVQVTWPKGTDPRPLVTGAMHRELGRTHHQVLADQEIFFHEKGRFRPLGPYLVHLALLFILAGGLIGKFWGIEGSLPILQGQEAQAFQVGRNLKPMDFTVRLDRFQVLYYEGSAMPKEFRSDLTFLKDGKETKAICRVNEPVTFGGLTFYQASYGTEPEGPVTLKVVYKERQETVQAPWRQLVELPGGEARIMISKIDGNLQGYGPAIQGAFITGHGMGGHEMFMIFKDHPEMNQPAGPMGPYRLALESAPVQYYSEFQVKHDPGVWWVYAGFLLFFPGFYLAFFRPHQRWALILRLSPKGGWTGSLLGASPRAREDFELRQAQLLEEFKKDVSS
ncbi:MAG: cytochrome c biogenesis protein ResB [Deltaproteobacteria bacterium]|nr:cytochrome c biogenesis protein ResB [Deltaproteobacteria bacterium]